MQDIVYGFFPGGDPRDFTPDYESCTPAEIERWKSDCEKWNRGERPEVAVSGWNESGTIHITRSAYGLGTYFFDLDDEEAEALAEGK